MREHETKQLPYEESDPHIKGVILAAVVLALGTALAFVLMIGAYRLFEARDRASASETIPATLVEEEGSTHPPEPVLQGAPGSRFELQDPLPEMLEMTAQEDELLGTPGWIDEGAGTVRIPIERAKELLLERGLPARPAEAGR